MRQSVAGLIGVLSVAVLAGCATKAEEAAPVTVTETATVTSEASESAAEPSVAASSSAYPSEEAYEGASSSVDPTSIRSVLLELEKGNRVGENLYQMPSSGGASVPRINWASRTENGDWRAEDCGVVIDVQGPRNYDERRRSSDCTGSVSSLPSVKTAGDYTITVEVTPPNGAPVKESVTITYIPYGA